MAANIWNSLAGYVIISVEGAYLERLINHITNSGIEIWDLSRQGGCIRLSVGIGGFYRLRTMAREYPCRIRILEKHGLTVALCHMGRRYVMAFGWIAALGVLLMASRFVWIIDIEGCSAVEETEVQQILAANGVSPGARRGSLDTAAIADAVMASDGRIAWAGAQLTGVVLQVSVKEAEAGADIYAQGEPCSIFASQSGVITSITALSGHPKVNAGDAVQAGEELISGSLGNGIFTEARGTVTAEVLHRYAYYAPWDQKLLIPTGKKQNGLWIEFMGSTVLPCIPPYDEYKMGETKRYTFTSVLPITVCSAEYSELKEGRGLAPSTKLMEITRAGAEAQMYEQLPTEATIISKNTHFSTDDTGMTCTIQLIAEQNIAVIGEVLPDVQQQ